MILGLLYKAKRKRLLAIQHLTVARRVRSLAPPSLLLWEDRARQRVLGARALCQAILIEGVTRFVTRDARCNSVMQAVILSYYLPSYYGGIRHISERVSSRVTADVAA
jgi:hypothetical protein